MNKKMRLLINLILVFITSQRLMSQSLIFGDSETKAPSIEQKSSEKNFLSLQVGADYINFNSALSPFKASVADIRSDQLVGVGGVNLQIGGRLALSSRFGLRAFAGGSYGKSFTIFEGQGSQEIDFAISERREEVIITRLEASAALDYLLIYEKSLIFPYIKASLGRANVSSRTEYNLMEIPATETSSRVAPENYLYDVDENFITQTLSLGVEVKTLSYVTFVFEVSMMNFFSQDISGKATSRFDTLNTSLPVERSNREQLFSSFIGLGYHF